MTDKWYNSLPRAGYQKLKKRSSPEDWFEIYELTRDCYLFYEPRHCEESISSLVIGEGKAILIDTGCGIGDLKQAAESVTSLPVSVVNTHTHADHIGSNRQFEEIFLFDHPVSHDVSDHGVPHEILYDEILNENLILKPWPEHFRPEGYALPPFTVSGWLGDDDTIDLQGKELEVIHTPGEAPNHICILDRTDRILFCGDILIQGSIWTHLEGGSLDQLKASYEKLMLYSDDFDVLIPSHNEPIFEKSILLDAFKGTEDILAGRKVFRRIRDSWGKSLKQYSFENFSILTR